MYLPRQYKMIRTSCNPNDIRENKRKRAKIVIIVTRYITEPLEVQQPNQTSLSVDIFSTKVLIGGTIFLRHPLEMGSPFYVVICATRRSYRPSLLSYFKTLSIGPAPGIKPATSRFSVKHSID